MGAMPRSRRGPSEQKLLVALCLGVWAWALLASGFLPDALTFAAPPSHGAPSLLHKSSCKTAEQGVGAALWSNAGTLGVLSCALVATSARRHFCQSSVSSLNRVRSWVAAAASGTPGESMTLFSPAKINLFLRIVRRRPDGYHDLASLFHTVAFGDTLDMEVLPDSATKDELECNLPGVPTDDSNLVIRALNLFREKSGCDRFFKMNLVKSTPAQAGMGGGSSNAAAAFFGANALCGSPGSPEDLIKWGDDPIIGSDATFFLSQGAAYCTGRGEIVTPVAQLPISEELPVYLVKPNYGLSTPKVFKALDLNGLSKVEPEELLGAFQKEGADHALWVNDLEAPAFEVCPELGELKDFLSSDTFGFKAVLMSGSGTTIYCLGEPVGGAAEFEVAVKGKFDIELVQRTHLMSRPDPTTWYADPTAA